MILLVENEKDDGTLCIEAARDEAREVKGR